jgi:hypothetical protein
MYSKRLLMPTPPWLSFAARGAGIAFLAFAALDVAIKQ